MCKNPVPSRTQYRPVYFDKHTHKTQEEHSYYYYYSNINTQKTHIHTQLITLLFIIITKHDAFAYLRYTHKHTHEKSDAKPPQFIH